MNSQKTKIISLVAALFSFPTLVLAFPTTLTGVIEMFTDLGLSLIPLLGAIAFLVFVYGVAKFIRSAGSEKDLKDSKNILIWGVIGLFVLVSVWGIITFIRSEFGFNGPVGIPQIEF